MTPPSQVSIIIPTWNTALITKKCIDSIRKHLPSSFYELIIVDNHSLDSTKKILSLYKNIRYYRLSKNYGFSRACNFGAKKAKHDLLFFLNSDMEIRDNSLVDMVAFYLSTSDCGLVGPRFLNPDLSPQGSVFPPQTALNAFKEYWLNRPNSYSKYAPHTHHPIAVFSISGGAVLISKNIFNLVGGWNETYFMYFEDLDLCRAVRKLNYQIYYFPNFKLIHRHGVSGANLVDQSNQWRRLIPSSKKFLGLPAFYLINFLIWSGQKFHRLFSTK